MESKDIVKVSGICTECSWIMNWANNAQLGCFLGGKEWNYFGLWVLPGATTTSNIVHICGWMDHGHSLAG